MAEQIEVFQDMQLKGPSAKRADLRNALIEAAVEPWKADMQRTAEMARYSNMQDTILFRREASKGFPAAGLALWENEDGYYVSNIVPIELGSLSFTEYNAILVDFAQRVAEPVVAKFGFSIVTTSSHETLSSWLSRDAADKLHLFSVAANKSTGSSHPSDRRRWLHFIVAAHESKNKLDAGTLARWLHEVEGWDEDSAHDLAGDFERSLDLLAFYDGHRA